MTHVRWKQTRVTRAWYLITRHVCYQTPNRPAVWRTVILTYLLGDLRGGGRKGWARKDQMSISNRKWKLPRVSKTGLIFETFATLLCLKLEFDTQVQINFVTYSARSIFGLLRPNEYYYRCTDYTVTLSRKLQVHFIVYAPICCSTSVTDAKIENLVAVFL